MADSPYAQQGFLADLLGAIDDPGQVVRNALKGRGAAAARNAVDFIDSPLRLIPGVGRLIPKLASEEDKVSGGELVGLTEPGWKKAIADIAIGTVTDPLSLLTFGAGKGIGILGKTVAGAGKTLDPLTLATKGVTAGAEAAAKGVDRVINSQRAATSVTHTSAQDALHKAQQTIKNTLGWANLTHEQRALIDGATALGHVASRAGTEHAGRILGGLTSREHEALGDAFDALHWKDGKPVAVIPGATVQERLRTIAAMDPALNLPQMEVAAKGMEDFARTQFKEGVHGGAFKDLGGTNDYLQRQFHRPMLDAEQGFQSGHKGNAIPSALKARQLETPEALLDYLTKNPQVQYERNALRRLTERAAQQGRLIQRAELGRRLVPGKPDFNLVDDAELPREAIAGFAKQGMTDYAARLQSAYNGMPPRDWFTSSLTALSRPFKQAVTSGFVIPRVAFLVRNQTGMAWQALSTPGVPLNTQRKAVRNLLDAFDDGFEKLTNSRLGDVVGASRSSLTSSIKLIDEAYAKAGGSSEAVIRHLQEAKRPDLVEAVQRGVTDGYISSEDIIKQVSGKGAKRWANLRDMPSAIMQGQEQRARLGTFLMLRDRHGADKAANLTKDAYLDYSVTSTENRALRSLVPFSAFLTRSIPQQARFLSAVPAVGAAAAPLFTDNGKDPKYEWMTGQAALPLGADDKGNPRYLTGTGLPLEALDQIPDLSRHSLEQAIGQTQPLLKTAYSYISGHDPQFGTAFGTYDRTPITGGHSEAGRLYNTAAATGLIAPLDAPLRQVSTLLDDRKDTTTKALQLLGGVRVASVDPDLAEQKATIDILSRNPQVRSATSYFQTGDDPNVDALLGQLKETKARLREKKLAASTVQ